MNEVTHSGFKHAILSSLAHLYLSFTGATTRINARFMPETNGFIHAAWHSHLALMLYTLRGQGISALVSRSADGEYAARVTRKFGFNTVRGSSSRGGAQSVMELVDRGRQGLPLAITPDGPRGPRRKAQHGIIYLAQKTGLAIMPVGVGLSSRIVLNSWDNFELPLPFGKAEIVYGKPIKVSEGDQLEAKAKELEDSLNSLCDQARSLLG
jgi:lysophospholipid acyltransferase (LPLAT)-like uncharacterized protein